MGGIEGLREDGVRVRGLGTGLSPDNKGWKSLGGRRPKAQVKGSALLVCSQRNNFLTVEQASSGCGNIPLLEIWIRRSKVEQKEMAACQVCCNTDSTAGNKLA